MFPDKMSQKTRQEKFWFISSLSVLNCFKYFLIYMLGQNVSKKLDKKNFELYKVFKHNFLCQNVSMLLNSTLHWCTKSITQ